MIVSLAFIILHFFTFFLLGIGVCKILKIPIIPSIPLLALSGMLALNALLAVLHFLFPVNLPLVLPVCCLAAAIAWMERKSISGIFASWPIKALLLPALAIMLCCALNISLRPYAFDTGSYHLQAIQWNEEYAIVPGLANLIRQLGFNSSWYLLQAFTGLSFIGFQSVYILNGLLLLIFLLYLLEGLKNTSSALRFIDLYRLLTLCGGLFLILGKYVGEVTADLPVLILTCWTFLLILESRDEEYKNNSLPVLLMIILPVYLLTVKISSVPLCIISVYMFFKGGSRQKLALLVSGFLLLAPWLAGNVILSGYLVFPFQGIDIFDFDWKVPQALIIDENYSIKGWARVPYYDNAKVMAMSFSEWFPLWLRNVKWYNVAFALILFLSTILSLKKIIGAYRQTAGRDKAILLTLTITAGLCFWFANAPDFRFAYGYLFPACCASCSLLLAGLTYKRSIHLKQFQLKLSIIAFLLISAAALLYTRNKKNQGTAFIIQPAPYQLTAAQKIQIRPGQNIDVATWEGKCWNMPLPCTCEYYPGLELRGNSLKKGFRITIK